jgi:undecaprenyl-diphosphatase
MGSELSWLSSWDRSTFEIMNRLFTSGLFDAIMPVISNLWLWIAPLAVIWVVYFLRTNRRGKIIALCCFLVVAATDQISNNVVKPIVARERPCNVVPSTHYYQNNTWITTDKFGLTTYKTSFSFPSSHATNLAGQAMYWSYFYPQLSPAFAAAAAIVGFSRIYLGVHWPSDIIAGYFLGIAIALLIAYPLRAWVLPED